MNLAFQFFIADGLGPLIIIVPKPRSAEPMSRFFFDRTNIVIATPAIARKGEKKLGLMIVMIRDSPPIAFSDSSHAVAVVPRFAPINIPRPQCFFKLID